AAVARLAARQQTAYRGEMVARALSMGMFMLVFIALWSAAFAGRGVTPLAGYSREQVLWYLVMTETIVLSTSRVFLEISEAVKAGDLAYTLVRPMHYAAWQVAHSLGNAWPRFLTNLVAGSVVVLAFTGSVTGSIPGLLGFLVLGSLALVLDAVVAVTIGLSAFWLEDVSPVFWIYQKFLFTLGGMLLPLEFFPGWLQRVAAWLPFQLIAYAPARTFVGFDASFLGRALAGQAAYLLGAALLVHFAWRRAQRRMVVQGG
ncbi:MAG: ABC-2 family transporter protein, partial [Candidatus Eisenbacteria bacterium]|nr:ABC-2 family transporter protein [Candidatus Eisenbacteria bacterium]